MHEPYLSSGGVRSRSPEVVSLDTLQGGWVEAGLLGQVVSQVSPCLSPDRHLGKYDSSNRALSE